MRPLVASALAAFLLSGVSCIGRTVHNPPPGAEVYYLEGENSFSVELDYIKVYPATKILVVLKLFNPGPGTVRFLRETVTLSYKGSRFEARDLKNKNPEHELILAPKQLKQKLWCFHIEENPPPGEYDLHLAGISIVGDGAERSGKEMIVKVRIPVPEPEPEYTP